MDKFSHAYKQFCSRLVGVAEADRNIGDCTENHRQCPVHSQAMTLTIWHWGHGRNIINVKFLYISTKKKKTNKIPLLQFNILNLLSFFFGTFGFVCFLIGSTHSKNTRQPVQEDNSNLKVSCTLFELCS